MIEKICEELDIKPEELVIENIIKENQQLKSTLEEIREYIETTIDIIKEQPTGNDEWILERLKGILDKGE